MATAKISKGLFEKHGVQVEKPVMFRSWAQLVEAFLSGNVNVVHLLSPMSLWAKYGANAPVKAVMWNHLAGSALTVRPEINSIAELSGKTVAIPFWYSIHNIVLQRLLRENGLKITEKEPKSGEVRLSVMAPSDMVAALASEAISGFIVAEPFNALAEAKGVGKVLRFSGDVWKDHACCLTLMHEYDIQHRPEWVQKVVNVLTEAQVSTLANRAETAQLLARAAATRRTIKKCWKRYWLQPKLSGINISKQGQFKTLSGTNSESVSNRIRSIPIWKSWSKCSNRPTLPAIMRFYNSLTR